MKATVISRAAGVLAIAFAIGMATYSSAQTPETNTATAAKGSLSEESLGNLLKAMGLKPEKVEKRYDFAFKAKHEGEEWKLSMSAVLSQNNNSVWIMAWLDKLPSSAADVPRTSLLRLLAANDQLGKGKFFAYIPSNKRFVLQRVIPNRNVSTRAFQALLQDLGFSVVETYPVWSVAGWKNTSSNVASSGSKDTNSKQASSGRTETGAIRTSTETTRDKNSTIR